MFLIYFSQTTAKIKKKNWHEVSFEKKALKFAKKDNIRFICNIIRKVWKWCLANKEYSLQNKCFYFNQFSNKVYLVEWFQMCLNERWGPFKEDIIRKSEEKVERFKNLLLRSEWSTIFKINISFLMMKSKPKGSVRGAQRE